LIAAKPQAVIDIAEANREMPLVESAGGFEDLAPRQHAGSGHRAYRPDLPVGAMRLPAPRPAGEEVAGGAAEPEHDACMLNRVVRKPQRSSNRPDIGPDGKSHHFGEPRFTYDLDIIVQEAQHLAGGRRSGAVVDRRPIEGTLVA
jgi:hypothetical protein